MLYIAIGIIGATVMPHNLYLHSAIVQTRAYERSDGRPARRDPVGDGRLTIALMLALFVNAAILILAASVFHESGHTRCGGDRRGLRASVAADGRRHRLDAVCRGASRVGPEFDGDRHACRADRHGRFLAPAPARLGAAAGDPRHGDPSRHRRHDHLWRKGDGRASRAQPGRPVDAASVRRHPPGAFRLRQAKDGRVRHPALGGRVVLARGWHSSWR